MKNKATPGLEQQVAESAFRNRADAQGLFISAEASSDAELARSQFVRLAKITDYIQRLGLVTGARTAHSGTTARSVADDTQ